MAHPSIQNIVKKINYITADVEIQKQILFAIPSEQKQEMEMIVKKIAKAKEQIAQLRQAIQAISPDEHQHIINIETGVAKFRELTAQKKIIQADSIATEASCMLICKDGREFSCLIKASDEDGNWTVLTLSGEVLTFKKKDVSSH